jgi:hypothetical protein
MFKPEGWEGIENEFNGVDKVRLQVTKRPS